MFWKKLFPAPHMPSSKQQDSLHRRWLARAFAEAAKSPHPKVKVGAVITTPDGKHMLAAACNDFSDPSLNKPARLRDGEKSFWIMCAEKRAIAIARRHLKKYGLHSLRNCRLYSTLDPCHTCADDIICAHMGPVIVPDDAHQLHPKLKKKWTKSIAIGGRKLDEMKIHRARLPIGSPPQPKKKIEKSLHQAKKRKKARKARSRSRKRA